MCRPPNINRNSMAEKNTMSSTIREPYSIPTAYQTLGSSEFEREALLKAIQADAVVIGAGITGSTLAVHLSEAGKSVVQLEANVPGWGGSGRAFGSVVPCHKNSEEAIIRHYGEQRGTRLIDALAHGPALVSELLNRHNIDAAFAGGGWAFGAHSKPFYRKLQKRAEYWQARNADVEYLNASEFSQVIGSDYYRGGLIDRRALSVNPYAYAKGLFKTAHQLGAKQYTHTPAVNVEQKGHSTWRVTTPQGSVECENVYFCTNAYTKGVWPGLEKGFVRVRGFGATTTAIDPAQLADILPQNHFITDTRKLWSGIRKLPSGQIHLGVGGPAMGAKGKADLKVARQRLKDVYPAIGSVEWGESWSGWIAISTDQFPRILRLANGVWATQGYSGRGIAMATLLGRELSLCQGDTERKDLMLPVDKKIPWVPFHPFSPVGAAAMIALYGIQDAIADRSK
jgi:glycine/D-amino acid oxidase-like deaminating enzyme